MAAPALLEHVAQTAGAAGNAQPILHFSPATQHWTTLPCESAFQLQLGMRYRF